MYISHTKINTYKQCPRKYKYHYIDLLSKKYTQVKPALSLSESVHGALRDFFAIEKPSERTLGKLQYLLRMNWQRKGFSGSGQIGNHNCREASKT